MHPNREDTRRETRHGTTKTWNDTAKTKAGQDSFTRNAAKIWNIAPSSITNAKTLAQAKKAIWNFCKTLPI